MFIGISVGHQKVLGVIPVDCVRIDSLRDQVPDLVQRLNHLVKGRVPQFDYTIMGSKIAGPYIIEEGDFHITAQVVETIRATVRWAQFTNHDHISFCMIPDLWETLDRFEKEMDAKVSMDRRLDAQQLPLQGIDLAYIQELARLNRLKDKARVGISHPGIQW
jgi:hypothetical protein